MKKTLGIWLSMMKFFRKYLLSMKMERIMKKGSTNQLNPNFTQCLKEWSTSKTSFICEKNLNIPRMSKQAVLVLPMKS